MPSTQMATTTTEDEQATHGDTMTDFSSFDEIARTIFAPAYPVIAAQIVADTGKRSGICLDIGCGGGYLGMAVAAIVPVNLICLDPSEGMQALVSRNLKAAGLSTRSRVIPGRAESIPLPDDAVDLTISRGSIFFWRDHVQAFREIYRVMKLGGKAYIGGGFGSAAIREEIGRKMAARHRGEVPWRKHVAERLGPDAADRFHRLLVSAGIRDFQIVRNQDKGLWIMMEKETRHDDL